MVAQVHEGQAFSKLLTTLLQGREGGSTKCGSAIAMAGGGATIAWHGGAPQLASKLAKLW